MKSVKKSLHKMGIKPRKARGQNFVVDQSLIEAIIEFGCPGETENIVEIGPGLGALTEALSRHTTPTLLEIEERFCQGLKRRFPKARVIQADAGRFNLASLGRDLVVFGNIPYVFSTAIILNLIRNAPYIRRAVLMLQREFAERLAAPPQTRSYGRISVLCQLWCDVRLGPLINGKSFHPPTRVESQLLELRFRPAPRYELSDPVWFSKILKASFAQRRKKIANSLFAGGFLDKATIAEALLREKIDPARRPETLSVEEYVRLSVALCALSNFATGDR